MSNFFQVPMKVIEKDVKDEIIENSELEVTVPKEAGFEGENKHVSDTKKRKSAKRNRRSTVYFKNLMSETDVNSMLEKKELTDEELLLLSRRQLDNSNGAKTEDQGQGVRETFKLSSDELRNVYDVLSQGNKGDEGMSCDQFMNWEEIQNIVDSRILPEWDIRYQFKLFVDMGNERLSKRNFQLLVNQIDLMGENEKNVDGKSGVFNSSMSEKTSLFLRSTLISHFLFDALSCEDITSLLGKMNPLSVVAGDIIIRENDFGDIFYCIEEGTATAYVKGIGEVKTYTSGGSFGELALIHAAPRAATVTATSDCKLWTLTLRYYPTI